MSQSNTDENQDIENEDSLVMEIHTTTVQEERSAIPAGLEEDRELLKLLESELKKRQTRFMDARTALSERQSTLWQAEARQNEAHRLFSLSKNVMDQIKREGQLTSSHRGPRDENSRHGRSLSSMDHSREALVQQAISTLKNAIAELQAANADLVIAQRNLATSEAFLQYCSRSLRAVGYLKDVTNTFVNDEHSATLPTPQLPDALWRRIFGLMVANDSELPREPQNLWEEWVFECTPLVLSHVCRSWRRITTTTPSLWSGVQIVFTKDRALRPDLWNRVIGLATGSPLRICITLTSEIGNLAGMLSEAFTDDHRVHTIKFQVTENAISGVKPILDVIPASQNLVFKGLTVPMTATSNPIKISSKHVMSVTAITVSNLVLERAPPFFMLPSPPWQQLQTLIADIPSLLRIDVGGTAPSLRRIVVAQPPHGEQLPSWYDSAIAGFNVEAITASELAIHSMSRGHIPTLLRYLSRLRYVQRLELYRTAIQPILTALKDNADSAQKIWLPALTELFINDYEQHGPALGLYVAQRLSVAQRSLITQGEQRILPLTRVDIRRSPSISEDILDLIEQHCAAGKHSCFKSLLLTPSQDESWSGKIMVLRSRHSTMYFMKDDELAPNV